MKLFSWEGAAFSRVRRVRDQELTHVKSLAYNIAAIMSVIWSSSAVMSLAAFGTYYLMGRTLTASIVFPCIFLFEAMTWPLLEVSQRGCFPTCVISCVCGLCVCGLCVSVAVCVCGCGCGCVAV